MIDNFEKNNLTSQTQGVWYSFTDGPNKGESKIYPADLKTAYYTDVKTASQALRFQYHLQKGGYTWQPYVALGLNVNTENLPIGKWEAISFDFKGNSHTLVAILSSVTDYANFQKIIPASKEWTTVTIPFTELKQPGWGKKVEFIFGELTAINWMAIGNNNDTGEVAIDNVRLLRNAPAANTEKLPINEQTIAAPQKARTLPEHVKVADWFGFNKAAYSLSFDDGFSSHYEYVAPVLEKNGLKGTFYLVTNFLESDSNKAASGKYGYWHQFKKMALKGHEMGSHSATHPRLTDLSDGNAQNPGTLQYELTNPIAVIEAKIPHKKVLTFAYPYVDFNQHVQNETAIRYLSARGLGGGVSPAKPNFMDLQGHIIMYTATRSIESDLAKVKELENKIEKTTIAQGGWSVYLAHEVLPFRQAAGATDSYHPVSIESFEEFCKWLKIKKDHKELWVATVADVTRYAKEREAIQMTLTSSNDHQQTYALTDDLADNIFNIPLSFQISLPKSWNKVIVKQGIIQTPKTVENGTLYLEAIPDRGKLEIIKLEE